MIQKIKIIFFAVIVSTVPLSASQYPKHQFGIGLNTISGMGLSYQIELDRENIFKLTTFPYYFGDNPPDELDFYFNYGLSYQRNFYKGLKSRVYGIVGFGNWYIEERYLTVNDANNPDFADTSKVIDINRIWNAGIGGGYEYTINNVVSLSFELGVQYQYANPFGHKTLINRAPSEKSFVGIGGGIGIRFNL